MSRTEKRSEDDVGGTIGLENETIRKGYTAKKRKGRSQQSTVVVVTAEMGGSSRLRSLSSSTVSTVCDLGQDLRLPRSPPPPDRVSNDWESYRCYHPEYPLRRRRAHQWQLGYRSDGVRYRLAQTFNAATTSSRSPSRISTTRRLKIA